MVRKTGAETRRQKMESSSICGAGFWLVLWVKVRFTMVNGLKHQVKHYK